MFCQHTKEFLSRRGIQLTERNILGDPDALPELRRLEYMMTPVTTVDAEVIVGFDESRLSKALGQ